MVEEYLGGVAMDLHRGGRNESTFDPILDLTNNSFENVGNDKRNKENAAVGLHGVQLVKMNNLTFKNSEKLDLHFLVGEPIIKVENTSFKNSRGLTSNDDAFVKKNVTVKR